MARIFFRGANLIDGIHQPESNATVVVDGEHIVAVSANGGAPEPTANDTVFDLAGKSLMPGMIQCHYHVAYDNIASLDQIDMKHSPTYLTLLAAKNAELLLRSSSPGRWARARSTISMWR